VRRIFLDAGLLHEVPRDERNEAPEGGYVKKWKTREPGRMPQLRDEDIQDRQSLTATI
jgi:hypothetical protein